MEFVARYAAIIKIKKQKYKRRLFPRSMNSRAVKPQNIVQPTLSQLKAKP
jgi:hypothetical protein